MPTFATPIANSLSLTILLDHFLNAGAHHQMKVWILLRLICVELEEVHLWQQGDETKPRIESSEISYRHRSVRRDKCGGVDFAVTQLQQPIGEAQLVHDLQH